MDRLANLEAFALAAELGSFTDAAARLGLSPSALSRRVAQLEGALGVRLFHRTTRTVRLSEEGRAFFERCRGAMQELRDAADALSRLTDRPAGLLRVEAPSILARHVLIPALSRLVARHAEVQVDLVVRDAPSDLVSDGIDVAVRLGPLADSGLVARRIGRTAMRVCGSPAYLRRRGTPRSVDALARHECLGFTHAGRTMPWRLADGGRVRELAPSRRIVVNSGEALIDLALSGAGLVWACDFMTARARRDGQLVEVLADAACEEQIVHLVSLATRHVLPKVRVFAELAAAELASAAR